LIEERNDVSSGERIFDLQNIVGNNHNKLDENKCFMNVLPIIKWRNKLRVCRENNILNVTTKTNTYFKANVVNSRLKVKRSDCPNYIIN